MGGLEVIKTLEKTLNCFNPGFRLPFLGIYAGWWAIPHRDTTLVSLEFLIGIKSFRSHYGPGVDPTSNRNEYQQHFLGVKLAGA